MSGDIKRSKAVQYEADNGQQRQRSKEEFTLDMSRGRREDGQDDAVLDAARMKERKARLKEPPTKRERKKRYLRDGDRELGEEEREGDLQSEKMRVRERGGRERWGRKKERGSQSRNT